MKCQLCPRKAVKVVESTMDESFGGSLQQKSQVCAEHLYHAIKIYSASGHNFTTRKV